MAQFLIRNLEDDIHHRLHELAKDHGQSMEEFVREVLRSIALKPRPPMPPLGSRLAQRFASCGLEDGERIRELKGQAVRVPEFE